MSAFCPTTEKIYCAPFDASTVLVIDPETSTSSLIRGWGEADAVELMQRNDELLPPGEEGAGAAGAAAGAGAGAGAGGVRRAARSNWEGAGGRGKWAGVAVSPRPEDKGAVLYCVPYNHPAVLRIDVRMRRVTTVGWFSGESATI